MQQANVIARADDAAQAKGAKGKKPALPKPVEQLTVPFNALVPWGKNPRKAPTDQQAADMASTLRQNRQLQPIGVRRRGEGSYEVFFGLTRYAGFKINVREGLMGEDHPVNVSVFDVDDTEALLIAIAENVARNDMSEIDVADAVADLAGKRLNNTDIMARLGLTKKRFFDHLEVSRLDDDAKSLLRKNIRPYNWGLALSQAPAPLRNRIVEEVIARPNEWTQVEQVRAAIREKKINAAYAIFDVSAAGIAVDRDLFEDGVGWIGDTEAFWKHQNAAIEATYDKLEAEGHAHVSVIRGTPFEQWRYRTDANGARRVAVIAVSMDGKVEIHKDLVTIEEDSAAKGASLFDDDSLFSEGPGTAPAAAEVFESLTTTPPRAKAQALLAQGLADTVLEALSEKVTGMRCLLLALLTRDGLTFDASLTGARQQLSLHDLKQSLGLSDEPTLDEMPTDEAVLAGALAVAAASVLPSFSSAKAPFPGKQTIAAQAANRDPEAFRRNFTPDRAFLEQLTLSELRGLGAELLGGEGLAFDALSTKQIVNLLESAFASAKDGTCTFGDGTIAALNSWKPTYVG